MAIHQRARALISTLSLPTPIAKYFTEETWRLDLSTNTNPYLGTCAVYPDILQTGLKNLYISTLCSLDHHQSSQGRLSPDNLLFTAGSLEGIDILIRTLGEPSCDRVCVLQPTFSAYEHWAKIHSLKVENIPFQGHDWAHVPVDYIASLSPVMVFLCNPNNPTGTVVDVSQIRLLCESLKGFVIVDEAYIEFSDFPSLWPLIHQYPNLILLRTFSKAWGLAGIRAGVILANPCLIHAFRHVQLPFGFSQAAQVKVRNRLKNPEDIFLSWKLIKKSRDSLREQLLTLGCVEKVFTSETNFLMIVFKNFQDVLRALEQDGIFVLNCSDSLPNSLRVSIGTAEQNQRFFEAVKKSIC